MTWEEFFKLIAGGLFSFCCLVVSFHAKAILAQLKELGANAASLQAALKETTAEVRALNDKVVELDKENASLRKSHDVLTRFLIGIGVLPPPPPPTLNDL